MFVANGTAEVRITVLEIYHMQRVKFSAFIYHISSATFLELDIVIFGEHFPIREVECRNYKYERHLWHVILGNDFLTAWLPIHLERVMFRVYIYNR